MPGFTDHIRCSLCLEEVEYLENPKQLPCSHLFCLGCLESNVITVESGVQVQCCVCSLTHELPSLESLTSEGLIPDQGTPDQDSPDQETTENKTAKSDVDPIFCDQCQTPEKSTAVCYCVTCDKKLCKHHETVHQQFFTEGDSHHIVSAQKYQERPKLYMRPKCVDHRFDIGICCDISRCFRCQNCTLTDSCKDDSKEKRKICEQSGESEEKSIDCEEGRCGKCEVDFKPLEEDSTSHKEEGEIVHKFHTLSDMEKIINRKFAEQLKSCSQKITDMCKREKETWLQIDNLEQQCEQLIKQVDTKAKELNQSISEEACRLTVCIAEFKLIYSARIEKRLEEMRRSRENLDELRCETEKFLLQNHVTELIKHEQEKINLLRQKCEKEYELVDIDMTSLESGLKKFTEYQFSVTPDTLVFLSELATEDVCYSVTFRDDGSLMLAEEYGVHLMKFPYCNDKEELYQAGGGATSVSLCNECCYVVSVDDKGPDNLNHVRVWNLNEGMSPPPLVNEDSEHLFKFELPGKEVTSITSTKDIVIATAANCLLVYNRLTGKLVSEKFEFQPNVTYFSAIDGSLLVSDFKALRNYEFSKENNLNLKWICGGLLGAEGITVTKQGEIIVSSNSQNCIFLISHDGSLLKTIHHEKYSPRFGGISTHNNKIAVPCWDDKEMQMFSLL